MRLQSFLKLLIMPFLLVSTVAHGQFDSLLPVCNPGEWSSSAFTSQTYSNFGGPEGKQIVLMSSAAQRALLIGGDGTGCANQNWAGLDGRDQGRPRAVRAYAEPSMIPINAVGTSVTLNILGLDHGGSFDTPMPECFPATDIENIEVDGCNYPTDRASRVAYRVANNAGVFDGPWTIATAGTNPWFKFTRESACPTGAGDVPNPSEGVPCTYKLEFFLSPDGTPTLTRSLQVVYHGSAARKEDDNFFPRASAPIPMLLYMGGSIEVELTTVATVTRATTGQLSFLAKITGDISSLTSPKVFLQEAPASGGEWSTLASGEADSAGQVLFENITVSDGMNYRAVLSEEQTDASIASLPLSITTPDPDGGNDDTVDTPDTGDGGDTNTPGDTETPEVQLTQNQQVQEKLSEAGELISQMKKKINNQNREEQLALRAALKVIADELTELLTSDVDALELSKNTFKVNKQSKRLRRALRKFSTRKRKGFGKRRKQARRAIKRFENALA